MLGVKGQSLQSENIHCHTHTLTYTLHLYMSVYQTSKQTQNAHSIMNIIIYYILKIEQERDTTILLYRV